MFRKVVIVVCMTLLLALLGLFTGLGYHVRSIEEVSFIPHAQWNFAEVIVDCDIVYNPFLFPFYWIVGDGHLDGNFSMMFVAEAYSPGEFGGPIFGLKPQDRLDVYVMRMVIWGFTPNLVLLFLLALLIEVMRKRVFYLAIFSSTIGFAVSGIIGAIAGLFVGSFVVAYILLRMSPENPLMKYWKSLWE